MWILPSRNRPDRVARMFDAAAPTTPGVVAIDDDQREMYARVAPPLGWAFDVSPRCRYVEKHNYVFRKFPGLAWYGSISDDMVPVTKGWDRALVDRAGRRGLAYANDLFTRRSGAFAVGGDLVRELGWIFCPKFVHYFGDTTMELIARELGLAGLQEDVVVEHRHYSNKRSPGAYDDTSRGRPRLKDERPVFDRWRAEEWPAVKRRLQAVVAGADA